MPSLPYVWPNGTGDTEKFVKGPRNSLIWRSQYGGIYRLWSGSTPEVYVSKLKWPGYLADLIRVVSEPAHLKEIFFD